MKKSHSLLWLVICSILALFFMSCGGHDGISELSDKIKEFADSQPGKIGVAVITADGDTLTVNDSADYPLMSMFKLHEAIAVCRRLDCYPAGLDSTVKVCRRELDPETWSPMMHDFQADEFTVSVGALLDYILIHSDNNASNILFDRIVSAPETDACIRSVLPQHDFRILYTESQMKSDNSLSYENRTSPLAYASLVNRLFTDSIVSRGKQDFVIRAMQECKTGMTRIAAGLPDDGRIYFAHRTGTGYVNRRGGIVAVNDGGYVRLPDGRSYTIVVLIKDFDGTGEQAESIIARISRAVYDHISRSQSLRLSHDG